jgi:hypothetical protein
MIARTSSLSVFTRVTFAWLIREFATSLKIFHNLPNTKTLLNLGSADAAARIIRSGLVKPGES